MPEPKLIRDEAKLQAPVATGDLGPNQPPPGTLKRSVILKQIPELSNKNKQTFFVTVRHGKKYRKQGRKRQPLARRLVLALCGVRDRKDVRASISAACF
jgi:hypothetical protein